MIINGKDVDLRVIESKKFYGYKLKFKAPNILIIERGIKSL